MRWSFEEWRRGRLGRASFRAFFTLLFVAVTASCILLIILHAWGGPWSLRWGGTSPPPPLAPRSLLEGRERLLEAGGARPGPRVRDCTHWDCLNVYRCGQRGRDRLSVYVYPPERYVDGSGSSAAPPISQQYYALLETIIQSEYYTPDPSEACLFVPGIDTLNQEMLNLKLTEQVLQSLP